MRTAAAVLLTFLAWCLVPAPASAQVEPSQCIARKYKAATIYAQKLGACKAKARAKAGDGQPDPACVAKADAALFKAFTKADAKGDCKVEGDAERIANEIDDLLASLEARLERDSRLCCSTDFSLCFYSADAGDCAALDGTAGLPGEVCSADGTCVLPPTAPGACCDGDTGGDLTCVTSPSMTEPACTAIDGTFSPSATCTPGEGCVVPVP